MEAASLHTYLRTGKWAAPPELSGTSIPRAENANIRGLSDPELSHRLISPTNLPFAFSPFSMTPLLQALIFFLLSLLFLSASPLTFSFSLSNGSQTASAPSSTALCLRRWVATKVKRGAGRGLLICTRNQISLALTKADFWSSNSCLYREQQDSFPDTAGGGGNKGEDGRLCTTRQENRVWTLGRSLGTGWGEEKRLPCLVWGFAHRRYWRGQG